MLTTHWTSQTTTASCLNSVSPASLALLCMLRPGNSTVDLTIFKADLQAKLLAFPQLSADQLHLLLQDLLDQHAPASRHKVSNRSPFPWFSSVGTQPLEAKRERRTAERQWIKSGLLVHKQTFRSANKLVNNIVHQAKISFYSTKILASNTSRQLFSITNSLLGKVKSSPLPSSIPLSELPQRFSDFFHSKVTSIRRNLDSTTVTPPSVPDQPFVARFGVPFSLSLKMK